MARRLFEFRNNHQIQLSDIIVYSGHVAIYIGNGMAVHGGFYGSQTVKYSANCGNTILGYVHIG